LKPVAGAIEKLSNAEVGAKVELSSFSGMMTVNTLESGERSFSTIMHVFFFYRLIFHLRQAIVYGENKKSTSFYFKTN